MGEVNEEVVKMLEGFNQRVCESNNEIYTCFACKLLVYVDYESPYSWQRISEEEEASLLRYDEEGHIATFCPSCTQRCSYCYTPDDLYCALWTDDHDDCKWRAQCY